MTGILSDEEMATIEMVNKKHFAWENRKGPLVDVILKLDADLISLVELDFYDDYFKPQLAKHGYAAVFKKRPRDSSDDGCGIFFRESVFTLIDSVRVARECSYRGSATKEAQPQPRLAAAHSTRAQLGSDDLAESGPRAVTSGGLLVASLLRAFLKVSRAATLCATYARSLTARAAHTCAPRPQDSIEFVDREDPVTKKKQKDRVGLLAFFRHVSGRKVIFISTHLARNPEDERQTKSRAKQAAQLLQLLCVAAYLDPSTPGSLVLTSQSCAPACQLPATAADPR